MSIKRSELPAALLSGGLALLLLACGGSPQAARGPQPGDQVDDLVDCESPRPVEAVQVGIVVGIPQDFDASVNPLPETQVFFTLLLPERCPDNRFPLILQTHGYGGSRIMAPAVDGRLFPDAPGLDSLDALAAALPHHGYAVISIDQRGHGESQPHNGGGYARMIDPAAETQDARAIIDWAYQHAEEYGLAVEDDSGIERDLVLGTLGYSYGGAFQLPLAALDARVDTIVPVATWHNLLYSLAAGGVVKQSWEQILCLFAAIPSSGAVIGAINTPLMRTLCAQLAVKNPGAWSVRTLDELIERVGAPNAHPRPVAEDELLDFMYTHSLDYFQDREAVAAPWGFGETEARLRPVSALLLQGNRDTLFNLTEAWLNMRYLQAAGGDVRLMSMESGHLNPVAGQVEGTANCGAIQGVSAILAWFDAKLKGRSSALYEAIPPVCLSVADTPGAPAVAPAALRLDELAVGSQGAPAGVPVRASRLQVTVAASAARPVFAPIATIEAGGRVLAGVPRIDRLEVHAAGVSAHAVIAQFGVGIRRGGRTFLVDEQLTAFVEGTHEANPLLAAADAVLLPALGERLQIGDELGLLFYEQSLPYSAVVSVSGVVSLPGGALELLLGRPLPQPVTSILNPALGAVLNPNPYAVIAEGVELPVIVADP